MSQSQGRLVVACKGAGSADFLDGYLTGGVSGRLHFYINQCVEQNFLLDGYLTGVFSVQELVR